MQQIEQEKNILNHENQRLRNQPTTELEKERQTVRMLRSELLTAKYDTQHEQRKNHQAKKQYEDILRVAQEQTALAKQYKAAMHKTPEQVEQQIPAIDTYKEVEQAPPPPAKVTSDASPKQ